MTPTYTPVQHTGKPPYPQDADEKIRRAAKIVFYDAPIQTLDMIKTQLFGSSEKAEQIANDWGQNTVMNDSKTEINTAKDNLAAYWEGPAYNAFNSYAGNAVGVMDKDLATMGTIATTLGQSVATVYQTYASAITFIGNCAADLGKAGIYVLLAAGTIEIPILGEIDAALAAKQVLDALQSFVKNVTALISSATTQIGQYKSQGISFANLGQQFQNPEPLPEAPRHVGEWHVHPNK